MNKKIYARQISPEYQESPLMMGGEFWPDDIIVTGNRDYRTHATPAYTALIGNIDSAADDLKDIGYRVGWYANATEYIDDVFAPYHKAGYNTKEIARWKLIAAEWFDANRDEESQLICQALYLMTGTAYEYNTIRGCCQGDWQEMYSPVHFNPDFVRNFEAEYFNTGTEWIVHDGDEAPESPDDISGYSMYCYSYNPAEEIARESGVDVADVVLYEFDGYTRTAQYKEVTA